LIVGRLHLPTRANSEARKRIFGWLSRETEQSSAKKQLVLLQQAAH